MILEACSSGLRADSDRTDTTNGTSVSNSMPAELSRPLHFPRVTDGRCPASRGRYVVTPTVAGIALGDGPVRVFINNAGNLRAGRARLASTNVPGWLALKTHFFSPPGYRGPFLVRAKRLDQSGPIALGATPTQGSTFFVPSGSAANDLEGWREFPKSTFVKSPGCYAWQVDGLTFSELIVVRMLPKFQA